MNLLTLALLIGWIAADPPAEAKVLDDVAKMQGTWTYASLEVEGKAIPADLLSRSRLEIAGVRFTHSDGANVYRGTFKLDVTSNPKTIDMTFTEGPEKGNTALGIYELQGDEWKLCLTLGKQPRPPTFATKLGSGYALETLKRRPPPTAEEIARAEMARFEGEWIMVSGESEGRPIPEATRSQFRRIVKADETLVMNGQQVFMRAKFSLNPGKKPMTIDYTLLEGANKGMKQLGIYEWIDQELKISFASPGKDRPTDWTAPSGSGRTISVWKRVKH